MEKRGAKLKLIFAVLILILLISKIDLEKINRKILNRLDNLISKIENKYLTQTKKCDIMYTQGRKT